MLEIRPFQACVYTMIVLERKLLTLVKLVKNLKTNSCQNLLKLHIEL